MRLLPRFLRSPEPTAADLADPVKNPDVRAAGVWEWTGFWAFVAYCLEELNRELALWEEAPAWIGFALVGLPILIRWIRQKAVKRASSFRRAA